jgi:hypothetical protein
MANNPIDGRLTSFNPFTGTLVGTELMYIVSPGNAAAGVSYNATISVLAGFFGSFPSFNRTIIIAGASYNASVNDTQIFANKTAGSATGILMPAAGLMTYPGAVLIKDAKGDGNTHNITITFTGGQLCDGLASVVIDNNYGYVWITPSPGVGAGATGWSVVG